jgi:hypothetical protein
VATASRLAAARAEHALVYGPPQQPCFTATASAPTGVERLTEHADVSKHTFYPHFSGSMSTSREHLRRIHHAGGMPTEQAIDTTDASPRSHPLPPR